MAEKFYVKSATFDGIYWRVLHINGGQGGGTDLPHSSFKAQGTSGKKTHNSKIS